MLRSILLCSLLLVAAGCSTIYKYQLVAPSEAKGIHPDSLKWSYSNGLITEIAVRNDNDEVLRLPVDQRTLLYISTTAREEHHFRMQSIVIDDKGDGLLGSTTSWRGYDTRQGAERTVALREVAEVKIWSRFPASRRILPR